MWLLLMPRGASAAASASAAAWNPLGGILGEIQVVPFADISRNSILNPTHNTQSSMDDAKLLPAVEGVWKVDSPTRAPEALHVQLQVRSHALTLRVVDQLLCCMCSRWYTCKLSLCAVLVVGCLFSCRYTPQPNMRDASLFVACPAEDTHASPDSVHCGL